MDNELKDNTIVKESEVLLTTKLATTPVRLAQATFSFLPGSMDYPYSPDDVDKLDLPKDDDFKKIVAMCRFFYRKEPFAATIINKIIDISISDLIFNKNGLSDNEFRVFLSIKDQLREFSEQLALEYLISGLVVPEIKFGPVDKTKVKDLGIKKYETLMLPVSMWVRDPTTITVNKTILSDTPSYFVHIPEELIAFILHGGVYPDGTKDPVLYQKLLTYYPEFVAKVKAGERDILLDIDPSLVIRRRVTTDSAYPTPYLYAALEAMKQKRNLRRMDYSIAARVISAIMLVRLGDKDFPITEDDKEAFTAIKQQLLWRDGSNKNIDRIFQLFANHTLQIDWKYPPTDALLNTEKYKSVNDDILVALGFPRILITGEAERSQASDASYATSSPVKTMETLRAKILVILNYVSKQITKLNNFKSAPIIRFRPLQLAEYATFMASITQLYQSGNLSRASYAELLGYNWEDEIEKRLEEEKDLKDSGIAEFAPLPNSRQPDNNASPQDQNKGSNDNNTNLKKQKVTKAENE